MKHVNIKVLAQSLNLSVSTVSKALRDSYEISHGTKEKVLAMAAKLNYTPNPYASSLRRRKSGNIAIVVPEVADSFFSVAINGIESVVQQKGYHALVYLTHESFLKEEAILKDFASGRVDGILISVARDTINGKHIQTLLNNEVPVIFFDRVCDDVETAKITTNDYEAALLATNHLLSRGCRNIAYLGISASLSISNQRMYGYKKALADAGYTPQARNVVACSTNGQENLLTIKKLLQRKQRPDGIIASVEKLITPAYLACHQLKLHIPNDVKIISFSNLETAPILQPSLTTITQPAFEMGQAAARLLLQAIDKKNYNFKKESLVIPSSIIVRAST